MLGDSAPLFKGFYDVTAAGNWEGRTILNRINSPVMADPETERELALCRDLLFRARGVRVRPGWDDKVLADWNGLMIAAMANAGLVFKRPDWIETARAAFDFVCQQMTEPNGHLLHSWRGNRARHPASVDDYANLCRAALSLYEATSDDRLLVQVSDWVEILDRHYWDAAGGGYFFSADDTEALIARAKTAADSAVPAGNGTLVGVLTRLAILTGDDAFRRRAEAIVETFSGELARNFFPLATLLNNAEVLAEPLQIVIVGRTRRRGIRRPAPRSLQRFVAEPGGSFAAARPRVAGRSSGARQGPRRRSRRRLCVRRPGVLAATDRPRKTGRQPRQLTQTSGMVLYGRGRNWLSGYTGDGLAAKRILLKLERADPAGLSCTLEAGRQNAALPAPSLI